MFYNLLKFVYGIEPESKELIEIPINRYRPFDYPCYYKPSADELTSNELHEAVQKILKDMGITNPSNDP